LNFGECVDCVSFVILKNLVVIDRILFFNVVRSGMRLWRFWGFQVLFGGVYFICVWLGCVMEGLELNQDFC
jgi:hypothetical protein